MTFCPQCGNALTWRHKLSGFTLSQRDRGTIDCPYCQTELHLTPGSTALQVIPSIFVGLALIPIFSAMDQPSQLVVILIALVVMGLTAVVSYLWFGRFRVNQPLSILTPRSKVTTHRP